MSRRAATRMRRLLPRAVPPNLSTMSEPFMTCSSRGKTEKAPALSEERAGAGFASGAGSLAAAARAHPPGRSPRKDRGHRHGHHHGMRVARHGGAPGRWYKQKRPAEYAARRDAFRSEERRVGKECRGWGERRPEEE